MARFGIPSTVGRKALLGAIRGPNPRKANLSIGGTTTQEGGPFGTLCAPKGLANFCKAGGVIVLQ